MQALKQTAHPITPKIRHSFVIDEILSEAQEGDYDLLVIGAHRKEMWQRLLLEDIAQELVRRADFPVLVVKQDLHRPRGWGADAELRERLVSSA